MYIITTEDTHQSTSDVMRWFYYYGEEVVRLNTFDKIEAYTTTNNLTDYSFAINGKQIDAKEIKGYWNARGFIARYYNIAIGVANNTEFSNCIGDFLRTEYSTLTNLLHYELLQHNNTIGNITLVNKSIVHRLAQKAQLLTPNTIITHNKQEVVTFKKQHGKIITKVLDRSFSYYVETIIYSNFTEEVTDKAIEKMPNTFFPSLFQEMIEKRYELRIYYLKGKFYSMAIFSQNDAQTKVDFRHYNKKKPNRSTPFILPKEQEEKLEKLMQYLHLDTGSIDMLVDNNNQYYFLEVNPVGQFGMTSYPCNYYLEEKIVKQLIHGNQ